MVDMNKDTSEWVRDRFAELAPASAWQPNPDVGLVHLKSYELMAKRRRRFQRAAAVAVLSASVLVLAALAACVMPARSAARLGPQEALRSD